jgi:hypothetical protein
LDLEAERRNRLKGGELEYSVEGIEDHAVGQCGARDAGSQMRCTLVEDKDEAGRNSRRG